MHVNVTCVCAPSLVSADTSDTNETIVVIARMIMFMEHCVRGHAMHQV